MIWKLCCICYYESVNGLFTGITERIKDIISDNFFIKLLFTFFLVILISGLSNFPSPQMFNHILIYYLVLILFGALLGVLIFKVLDIWFWI